MRKAKPRGSFRPDPAPESKYVPLRLGGIRNNPFGQGGKGYDGYMNLDQAIYRFRVNQKAQKEIKRLLEQVRKTNPQFVAKIEAANPKYAMSNDLVPKDAAGIYDSGTNTISLDPQQAIALAGLWGKREQRQAEAVLLHEQAHANQFRVDGPPKSDWAVEAQAELKARKVGRRLYGRSYFDTYEDFVKKFINRGLGR
jgi:hypothetical protein